MLISWLSDIWPISCATRWEMGAVDVTHGHEPPRAARRPATPVAPVVLGWADAGTASSPPSATAAATATSRPQYLRPRNNTRLTPATAIPPPPMRTAFRQVPVAQIILCTSAITRQDRMTLYPVKSASRRPA